MRVIAAAVLAAILSFICNRAGALLAGRGCMGIGDLARVLPVLEEALKTTCAVATGAPVIWTHVVFGLIEGIYDLIFSQRSRVAVGIAGVAGHSVFGVITVAVSSITSSLSLGVIMSCLVHILWNTWVVRDSRP